MFHVKHRGLRIVDQGLRIADRGFRGGGVCFRFAHTHRIAASLTALGPFP